MKNNIEEITNKINCLESDILERFNRLNHESLWLFVATLSCWSVDNTYIRTIAILLVFFFFFKRVSDNKSNNEDNFKRIKDIETIIQESGLVGDSLDARYYRLDKVKKDNLTLKNMYKSTKVFLVGYAFWSLSLLIFLIELNDKLSNLLKTS